MNIEFNAAKYNVKNNEIRELYLIRKFPPVGGEAFKSHFLLNENITKKMREIN